MDSFRLQLFELQSLHEKSVSGNYFNHFNLQELKQKLQLIQLQFEKEKEITKIELESMKRQNKRLEDDLDHLSDKKDRVDYKFQVLSEKYNKLVHNINSNNAHISPSPNQYDSSEEEPEDEFIQKKQIQPPRQPQKHAQRRQNSPEISLKQLPKKKVLSEDSVTQSHESQETLTLSGEIETDFFSKPPIEDAPIFRKQKSPPQESSSVPIKQNKTKSNHVENLLKQWEKPKKKPLPKPTWLLSQSSPTDKKLNKVEDDLINEPIPIKNKKKEIDLKRKKTSRDESNNTSTSETPTKKSKKKSNFEPNLLTVVYEDVKKEKPNLTYGKLAQYDLTGDELISDVVAKRTIPKSRQSTFEIKKTPEKKTTPKNKEKGQICEKCKAFYDAIVDNEEERAKMIEKCSRHRHVHSPPSSPPGFWEFDKFPSQTQKTQTETQTQKNDTNPSLIF
eukprot:gene1489-12106_t